MTDAQTHAVVYAAQVRARRAEARSDWLEAWVDHVRRPRLDDTNLAHAAAERDETKGHDMTNLKEISPEDREFGHAFSELLQQGCDPHMITAFHPMLTSSNVAHVREAEKQIWQVRGGDLSDKDQFEKAKAVRAAQRLVAARGYKPTPAHIEAEFCPTEEAMVAHAPASAPYPGRPHGTSGSKPRVTKSTMPDWTPTKTSVAAGTASPHRVFLPGPRRQVPPARHRPVAEMGRVNPHALADWGIATGRLPLDGRRSFLNRFTADAVIATGELLLTPPASDERRPCPLFGTHRPDCADAAGTGHTTRYRRSRIFTQLAFEATEAAVNAAGQNPRDPVTRRAVSAALQQMTADEKARRRRATRTRQERERRARIAGRQIADPTPPPALAAAAIRWGGKLSDDELRREAFTQIEAELAAEGSR